MIEKSEICFSLFYDELRRKTFDELYTEKRKKRLILIGKRYLNSIYGKARCNENSKC